MQHPQDIGILGLVGAASLLLFNAGLSVWLRLALERRLLLAALRTVVQLSLLGYVLVPVFEWNSAAITLSISAAMVLLAAREGVRRTSKRYRRATFNTFVSLLLASVVTLAVATRLVLNIEPWWQPRYVIPILGMILGNALTGVSLGLDRALSELKEGRARVEASLAFGATRWEAARPVLQESLRSGLIPIVNSMSVVGLVTIPGMMTGQMLAGTSPSLAARYQIMIMFLVASATALGAGLSVLLTVFGCFDDQLRLRPERIIDTQQR
jgi:putative ABC transport system permease protein